MAVFQISIYIIFVVGVYSRDVIKEIFQNPQAMPNVLIGLNCSDLRRGSALFHLGHGDSEMKADKSDGLSGFLEFEMLSKILSKDVACLSLPFFPLIIFSSSGLKLLVSLPYVLCTCF